MAVLDAWLIDKALSEISCEAFNASISIEFWATGDAPLDTHTALELHDLTSNLPVTTTPRSIDATIAGAWFDDYYYRIHVAPSKLELGNLLSSETRQIEVWNAHQSDKTFLGFEYQGDTSGLSISGLTVPNVFVGNQSKIISIGISNIGSPEIDAAIRFDFGVEKPAVSITGKRVVVFNFKPTYDFTEDLEWYTNIIKSKSAENRLAIRQSPRQSFNYAFNISSTEYAKLKAIANQWVHRIFAVPAWLDGSNADDVPAGSVTLNCNTLYKDFRSTDLLLAIGSNTSEILECESLTDSSITLSKPTSSAITNCIVYPLRFSRLSGDFSVSRGSDQLISLKARFAVQINRRFDDISEFPTFVGLPVLNEIQYNNGAVSHKLSRELEWFDNESGQQFAESLINFTNSVISVNLVAFNRQEQFKYRNFFGFITGKQKPFFLSSENADFILFADVVSGQTSISVQTIDYQNYFGVKYIEIVLVDGSRIYRKILSGVSDSSIDILTLSESLPSIDKDDVDRISFLQLVRLESDTVKIRHSPGNISEFSFTVSEVPDVV